MSLSLHLHIYLPILICIANCNTYDALWNWNVNYWKPFFYLNFFTQFGASPKSTFWLRHWVRLSGFERISNYIHSYDSKNKAPPRWVSCFHWRCERTTWHWHMWRPLMSPFIRCQHWRPGRRRRLVEHFRRTFMIRWTLNGWFNTADDLWWLEI